MERSLNIRDVRRLIKLLKKLDQRRLKKALAIIRKPHHYTKTKT